MVSVAGNWWWHRSMSLIRRAQPAHIETHPRPILESGALSIRSWGRSVREYIYPETVPLSENTLTWMASKETIFYIISYSYILP